MKPVSFLGDSLDALRAFPQSARRMAGLQLDRVQRGLDPESWKPMSTVGAGVREIRVRDAERALFVFCMSRSSNRPCTCCTVFRKKAPKPVAQTSRPAGSVFVNW